MSKLLRIIHPPGYAEERNYVFRVIFEEFLGLSYDCQESPGNTVQIRLIHAPEESVIVWPDVLFQTKPENWLTEASLPQAPLPEWNASYDLPDANLLKGSIPVIYGKLVRGESWFTRKEKVIQLGLDIAGSVFFMLTRYEEAVLPFRDEHGRFSAKKSLAFRGSFLDRPIVDEYIEVLWACMKNLWSGLRRRKREYRVWLSHDVDNPLCAVRKPWVMVLRNAAGDLIRRRNIRLFTHRIQSKILNDPQFDPCNTFDFIMSMSERYSLKSTFFFKAGRSNPLYDDNYSLEDARIQTLMQNIYKRGHELGIHPSYESYRDQKTLRLEYEKLQQIAESLGIYQERWGSRQHYLRWENPVTWQICEETGLDYDATLGFADHVGFRCGTCHEFPVFNLRTRRPLSLRERPLIAMDATLLAHQYMALRPEQVLEWIERLATICRGFGGTFSLLWHNSSLIQSWESQLYLEILGVII